MAFMHRRGHHNHSRHFRVDGNRAQVPFSSTLPLPHYRAGYPAPADRVRLGVFQCRALRPQRSCPSRLPRSARENDPAKCARARQVGPLRRRLSAPRFYQGRAFAGFFQNTNGVACDCFQPAGNDMPDRIIAAVIIAETDHQGLQMRCHKPFRKANREAVRRLRCPPFSTAARAVRDHGNLWPCESRFHSRGNRARAAGRYAACGSRSIRRSR
jgi:hypothetical protein